LEIAKKEKRLL